MEHQSGVNTANLKFKMWHHVNCKAKHSVEWDHVQPHSILFHLPGESIPIRLFLAGYDLTPTMRDINKKFSVRYYLNLVLIDEEERRYFKQQVKENELELKIQVAPSVSVRLWISCSVLPSLANKTQQHLNSSTRGRTSLPTWEAHSTPFWLRAMVLDFEVLILIPAVSHLVANRSMKPAGPRHLHKGNPEATKLELLHSPAAPGKFSQQKLWTESVTKSSPDRVQ